MEIKLENGEIDSKMAKVIDYDEKYDIALLQLPNPINHINDFLMMSSDDVNENSKWKTVGYPKDWNENSEGTDYCYIDGGVHYKSNFENQTIYDLHLTSPKIKEDWPYSLGGLSGSPLVVDGTIKGILIYEENSAINSQLKAISFRRCESFFIRNSKIIKSTFKSEKNQLLRLRLEDQKKSCKDLFQKMDYKSSNPGLNLTIDSYFLRYHDIGTSKLGDLAKYFCDALHQYANNLSEVKKLTENPMKMFNEINNKTKEAVVELHRQKRLGSIILWMLLEGVLEVPKFFTRYSLNQDSKFFSEIHLGMKQNKLVFYVGEGQLSGSLIDGVTDMIDLLRSYTNIQEDAFSYDSYIYENMNDGYFKDLIDNFMDSSTRDWSKIDLEITVFTGYNSKILKSIEEKGLIGKNINELIKQFYLKECVENHDHISNIIKQNSEISNVKINWFVLPFIDTLEFENMIINKF